MPSGFYLADSLLLLGEQFGGGMIVPTAEGTKPQLALKEAKRIKKLVGYLRYLFRNRPLVVDRLDVVCGLVPLVDHLLLPPVLSMLRRRWTRQPHHGVEAALGEVASRSSGLRRVR